MKFDQLFQAKTCLAVLLFALVLDARGESYSILHHFTGTDGKNAGGLLLAGDILYGTTWSGGASNHGTLFRLNTNGSDFRVLKDFAGGPGDGAEPSTALLLSGDVLYGTTGSGGSSNCGTLFSIRVDGSNYVVLRSFTGSPEDGSNPGSLGIAGSTLFGTTYSGGWSNAGTLFQINTDGSGYTILKQFTGKEPTAPGTDDGRGPSRGLLAISEGYIYGSTVLGGATGDGLIYKFRIADQSFTPLKHGSYAEGSHFAGTVLLSGSVLYGTCVSGGGGLGAVFKLNTDGSDYQVLRKFTGFNGVNPIYLILSGAKLYGTAYSGAISNAGAIYQVNLDSQTNATLKEFNGLEGGSPSGLAVSGSVLYGATGTGGNSGCGVIYSLSLPVPVLLTSLPSQTAEIHATVRFSARLGGSQPFGCTWFFNETNLVARTTNSLLELADVQLAQAGAYTLVASNLYGAVTSSPAVLSVIAPVPRRIVPGLKLGGPTGASLTVDYTETLGPSATWALLDAATLTNSTQWYFDLANPMSSQRFYRARAGDSSSFVPTLGLNLVPALALSGAPGTTVHIEYLNQFGPTDAWTPLATVPLTSGAELYYDVSAVGQPPRLWRLSLSP